MQTIKFRKLALYSSVTLGISNVLGWHTRRKIIVFESDDWGSARMASKEAYNFFLAKGYKVKECVYNKNDCLENNKDMEMLFAVLSTVKDKNDNHPVFTANMIMANPDFNKIKDAGFQQYFYEPFTKTLKRYPNHDRVLSLYKEGIDEHIFKPQFHGREHLNIAAWMKALRDKKKEVLDAFDNEMFTIHVSGVSSCRREYLKAFGGSSIKEIDSYIQILMSGIELFESTWGFKPKSFIAPCYTWPVEIEKNLSELGIKYIQGIDVQRVPTENESRGFKKKYHYTSQYNKYGQRYLVRNAFFEPSADLGKDWVDACMNEIGNAFFWQKPAIISSHRVNYIGGINPRNRTNGLQNLKTLLKKLLQKYPDIEFMASDELGDVMSNNN